MMRICVKVEIVVFVTQIWFWAYVVRPESLQCNFCEKKELRKKLGICYGSRGAGMDLSAWVFSLYKYIRVYSLLVVFCNSSQIDNEAFSSAHGFFSRKGFHVNLVFFLYFVFLYCVIDHNNLL